MRELCVVLDIDDTLYLESAYVRSGFLAVGNWAERWLGIRDFSEACWGEFEAGRRSTIFNQALANRGCEPTQELISCLVELYRAHEPAIRLEPDAAGLLGQLSGRYPVAVLSDGPLAAQSRKADALELRSVASPVVLTEVFGAQFRKPHTRAFLHVAERVPAKRYVYIADNPHKDFDGPRALGWGTIRVRREGGLHCAAESREDAAPDFELPDCSEVMELLARSPSR